ncbi:FimB/Mfa2 family fimbrial subunit [Bacteroides thetaiotaomicron]|uniref:FimB/Mfa2 family fimbrial subunit n=1 Tax=Bacteroides thetaiotaomicron TaxID=818 RepID=UPI003DA3BFAD
MKRKLILVYSLFAAMVLGACSENNGSLPDDGSEGAKSKLVVQLNFAGVGDKSTGVGTRAPQSTAIPATSWSNIKQVQFLLYDATTNLIRFSAIATPESDSNTFTYTDIPVGTYKLVAVANAKSSGDNIVTYLDGGITAMEWDMWNVRQKDAANLVMTYKGGEFPTFCSSEQTAAGNTAYIEPSEIFMGSSDVTIAQGVTAAPTVSLTREVSLMRVRLNVKEGQSGVDNESTVDFAQNASIMIYRLPEKMGVLAGDNGGVKPDFLSKDKYVLSIFGSDTFKTTEPTSGYTGTVLGSGNFTMWRDIVVFPNNGGRANNSVSSTASAAAARQYFIVISATGKSGHVLANGTKLSSNTPIYWTGTIKENFVPNVIREVNLTLRTGGTTDVPVEPTVNGDLTITVSEPAPWNGNIVESSIIL